MNGKHRDAHASVSPPATKKRKMKKKAARSRTAPRKKQVLPRGWTEERVRKVLAYYERQTEDEELAEYEQGMRLKGLRVMLVPAALVPAVQKLISHRQGA